ncbi:MAG: ComF family protein [Clostridia bacterium]|nr:ComF family protein [Clostridia bacterium]
MIKLSDLQKFASEALFPKSFTCDICGIETFDSNLCPDCLKTVTFNNGTTCPVCGRKTFSPEICLECKAEAPRFKKAVSALVYDGGGAALISIFKNGCGYLKEYFADLITEKADNIANADCIVYIPMTKKAERRRGYNQAELLAKSISKRLNIPVLKNGLIKTTETAAQKSLAKKERASNLADCFKVDKPEKIKDNTVLLVDDVLTTGATADAACKKLLHAGAKCVYFAAVASVEYKLINKKEQKPNR